MHMPEATLEALHVALGQVVAQQRKNWDRERELYEAKCRTTIAELQAVVVDLQAKVDRALMAVRNGEQGLPGLQGPQGEQGERGLQGLAGPAGERGERGQDGSPGLVGPPGERGLQGLAGIAGERGPQGDRGDIGQSIKGDRGDRGEKGERGLPGEIGKMGLRGEPGLPGARGEAGAPGERGERGPVGMLPVVKVWETGVHYEGDVVTRAGATYQATKDTADEPGSSKDWVCLARAGVDGRSPVVRGLFRDEETYGYLDMVALGGSTFIAKKDNPGPCPGAGWQLMVSQGKAGPKGERGLAGERGERGLPGVSAATIVDWQIDRETFTAVPIMSDGREGKALPLRPLFEQFQLEAR